MNVLKSPKLKQHITLTKTFYITHQHVQVLRSNFLSAKHEYVKKFVQLYAAVCTPMKQRKLVVDRIRVQYGLFCSSKAHQSQKTGSYTVTASLACFQWLLCYIISPPHKTGKGNALPRHNSKRGRKKKSYIIHHIYTFINHVPAAAL